MEQGHLCHVSTSLGPAQTALSHRHPALRGGPESFSGSLSQPAKSRGLWGVDSVSPSASFRDVGTEVPESAWVPAMPSGSQPMQTFLGDLRQDLDPSVFTHLYNRNHTDLTNSPASRGSKTIFKVLLVTCHPSRCSQIAGLAFPHFSTGIHPSNKVSLSTSSQIMPCVFSWFICLPASHSCLKGGRGLALSGSLSLSTPEPMEVPVTWHQTQTLEWTTGIKGEKIFLCTAFAKHP